MLVTFKLMNRLFGEVGPAARLPFEPPPFLQRVTHRGLTGADPRDCSAVSPPLHQCWGGRGGCGTAAGGRHPAPAAPTAPRAPHPAPDRRRPLLPNHPPPARPPTSPQLFIFVLCQGSLRPIIGKLLNLGMGREFMASAASRLPARLPSRLGCAHAPPPPAGAGAPEFDRCRSPARPGLTRPSFNPLLLLQETACPCCPRARASPARSPTRPHYLSPCLAGHHAHPSQGQPVRGPGRRGARRPQEQAQVGRARARARAGRPAGVCVACSRSLSVRCACWPSRTLHRASPRWLFVPFC